MPVTFPSHQGAVLPLKLLAPRWFDGTALVVGTAVPDLVNAWSGTPWDMRAHAPATQLWLSWPLAVVAALAVKWLVAPVVAPHLPDRGPFHLRDYGALRRWPDRVPWPRAALVLAVSALVGPFSHLALDAVTHGDGWLVARVPALQAPLDGPSALVPGTVHVYDVLETAVAVLTAAVTVMALAAIGRRRLVRAAYGPPPAVRATAASRRLLVAATAVGGLVGMAVTVALRDTGSFSALVLRPVDLALVGLLVGCRAARSRLAVDDPTGPPRGDRRAPAGVGDPAGSGDGRRRAPDVSRDG